jgi:hypothetical protein
VALGSHLGNQFGLTLYDSLFGDLRAAEDPNNYAPPGRILASPR